MPERTTPDWTPFRRVGEIVSSPELGLPDGILYRNNRYQVVVRHPTSPPDAPLVWLSIKRIDNQPCRDWRDFQRLKNELLGPEVEAVELYPAEGRRVDAANQYHIWAFPGQTLPFGFAERLVAEGMPGVTQRPFEDDATRP
jgi:hypothetical protein